MKYSKSATKEMCAKKASVRANLNGQRWAAQVCVCLACDKKFVLTYENLGGLTP